MGNAKFQPRADLAFRKSIVLLRNARLPGQETKTLPFTPKAIGAKTKIYFESYFQKKGTDASNVYQTNENKYDIEFVKTPEEADAILMWITSGSKSLFDADGSPLYLSLSKNAVDVDYVNKLTAKKPTVLVINYTNPWVIDEFIMIRIRETLKQFSLHLELQPMRCWMWLQVNLTQPVKCLLPHPYQKQQHKINDQMCPAI